MIEAIVKFFIAKAKKEGMTPKNLYISWKKVSAVGLHLIDIILTFFKLIFCMTHHESTAALSKKDI